jgi:hypothetical protein
MKADRRHELQENTLAHVLTNFPLYLSIYGGRILLVLSLIVLLFVLLNYRKQAKVQQAQDARVGLSNARELTMQIGQLAAGFGEPSQIAQQRSLLRSQIDSSLEVAAANADTDTLKAETELARAELFWTLANLSALPGATTQPALALPEKRDDLLSKAESNYQTVMAQFPKESFARGSALLGLGAIAENRGQFDVAQQKYDELAKSDLAPTHKVLAEQRLAMLPLLRTPRKFVPATMPATQPAIAPLIDAANAPVEATTQPTSSPSN